MPETYAYSEPVGPTRADAAELERINQKLDWLAEAVGRLDRRRDELEEMVADLIPAANGAVGVAAHRLAELERNGSLDFVRGAVVALETASRRIDPADLVALAEQAHLAVGTLRAATTPEVAELVDRSVEALHSGRTGRPPRLLDLLRRLRKPQVRRGMGALLELLSVLGAGAQPARSVACSPARRTAAGRPGRPASVPTNRDGRTAGAKAGATPATEARVRELAGRTVAVDPDGFLVDPAAWSPEVAEALAAENGLGPLTDAHWRVLEFCRRDAEARGGPPGLRRITQELGIPPKKMYELFPRGPGLLASKLAGLGKPKSCV